MVVTPLGPAPGRRGTIGDQQVFDRHLAPTMAPPIDRQPQRRHPHPATERTGAGIAPDARRLDTVGHEQPLAQLLERIVDEAGIARDRPHGVDQHRAVGRFERP